MDDEISCSQVLNVLDKPVLVINSDYHIVAANNSASEAFSLPVENIIGQECHRVTHNVDSPCWVAKIECPVKAAFYTKERTTIIHQYIHTGENIIEEITAVPILDAFSHSICSVCAEKLYGKF
jgi:PAS domain-containing protein